MGFFAAFFANSAMGRFIAGNIRTIITWLVVAALIVGAVLYVKHLHQVITDHEATIAQQQETIGGQKQRIQTLADTNKALTAAMELKRKSEDITNHSEADLAKAKTDNQVASNTRVAKHDDYVKKIQADPVLPPAVKDKMIAKADIDVLWGGYCAMKGVNHPTCALYATTPPANPTPAPDMGQMLEKYPPPGATPVLVPPAKASPPPAVSQAYVRVPLSEDLAQA